MADKKKKHDADQADQDINETSNPAADDILEEAENGEPDDFLYNTVNRISGDNESKEEQDLKKELNLDGNADSERQPESEQNPVQDENSEKKEALKKLQGKSISAFILMLVIFIPISIILFSIGISFSDLSEKKQEQMKLETLNNIVDHGIEMAHSGTLSFDSNLRMKLDLMSSILSENVQNGTYNGPVLFDNGFVATLDGDDVILPEGVIEGEPALTRSIIETGLNADALRSTGYMTESGVYLLSYRRLTDESIYVEMTSDQELMDYLDPFLEDTMSALENSSQLSDCMTLVVSRDTDSPEVLSSFSSFEGLDEIPTESLTKDILKDQKSSDITVGDQTYRCICIEAAGNWIGQNNVYVLHIFPSYSYKMQMIVQAAMVCILMFLIFLTLIVYTISEQKFVLENVMTKDQAKRYNPTRLRRKVMNAGIVGAIAILLVAFMTQAVGQMQNHIRYGKETLHLLTGDLSQSVEKLRENIQDTQEQWYTDCCNMIVTLLNDKPELATKEKLANFSSILNAEFIMLFDHNGNEIVSSNDFTDFTLDKGLGDSSSDFRRLLMGVPSIVHTPSTDKITDLTLQMIGVTMKDVTDQTDNGALIIALDPENTDIAASSVNVGSELALATSRTTLCFIADNTEGMISVSTDENMVDKTVFECGLSENSLQDGYMDFGSVNGVRRYIITARTGNNIAYYTTKYTSMLIENLIFSAVSVVLYIIALIIILTYLLNKYNKDSYRKWAVILIPTVTSPFRTGKGTDKQTAVRTGSADQTTNTAKQKITAKSGNMAYRTRQLLATTSLLSRKMGERNKGTILFINRLVKWDEMMPEKKASMVFYFGMFIMLQLWVIVMLISSVNNISPLEYLLRGDWQRGFNAFSVYSILLITAIANLIFTISSWILQLISGFLSSKGETVCNLIRSIIKYISIIVVIFISMNYLGVLNDTVIASVGLGSLALSLGAKDIVADVLSGILIVFEETLRIGDYVTYDGKYGIVLEIGMRTTRLLLPPGNDILEVRNQEIVSVINMSKSLATVFVSLNVRASEDMDALGKLITDALPEIGEKCEAILAPPTYSGITRIGNNAQSLVPMVTVSVVAKCDQKDYYVVLGHLNRALFALLEKNGISLY